MEKSKHVYFTTAWHEWDLNENINNFLDGKYEEDKSNFNLINIDVKPVITEEKIGFMATILYQE